MTELTISEVAENEGIQEPVFFGVSVSKMIIMSLFTFGLYNFYWFYKNFDQWEKKYDGQTMPFMRALFSPIFAYSLFTSINFELENKESGKKLQAGWLAALYFVLNLIGIAPNPYWLISFLVVLPLLGANQRINDLCSLEILGYEPDSKLSWINWMFLLVGGALTLLMLIGLFLIPQNL